MTVVSRVSLITTHDRSSIGRAFFSAPSSPEMPLEIVPGSLLEVEASLSAHEKSRITDGA
jgi:hypothetical protein